MQFFLKKSAGRRVAHRDDIRSPLTISILQSDTEFKKEFSLALNDADAEQFVSELLQDNPRRLHEMVAQNPLVGTRVFHWTVRLAS